MSELRTFQLPGGGLNCGNCGAVLPTVKRTIETRGFITRERICPECNHTNTTSERVIGTRQRRSYCHRPPE